MTTLFYRYLPYFDPRVSTYYTPSMVLVKQSPLLASVASIKDQLVPPEKYKVIANGLPADWKYGRVDFEPEALASIGWTPEAMSAMAEKLAQHMGMEFIGKDTLAGELRAFTTLAEREPGLFVLEEASKEFGEDRPERTIDLQ